MHSLEYLSCGSRLSPSNLAGNSTIFFADLACRWAHFGAAPLAAPLARSAKPKSGKKNLRPEPALCAAAPRAEAKTRHAWRLLQETSKADGPKGAYEGSLGFLLQPAGQPSGPLLKSCPCKMRFSYWSQEKIVPNVEMKKEVKTYLFQIVRTNVSV